MENFGQALLNDYLNVTFFNESKPRHSEPMTSCTALVLSGLSLRAWGQRFLPATMSIIPGYFHGKWKRFREREPKEIPNCLIFGSHTRICISPTI